MRKLSNRAEKTLALLKANPDKKYSFGELAEKFGTCPSGMVSTIRSLGFAGHGEFRDQVKGEKYLYDLEARKQKALDRRKRGIDFPGGRTKDSY